MKKYLAFLIILALLPLAACGGTPEPEPEESTTAATTEAAINNEPLTIITQPTTEPAYTPPPEIVPANTSLPKNMPPLGEGGKGYSHEQFFAATPDGFYTTEMLWTGEPGYSEIMYKTLLRNMKNPEKAELIDEKSISFCGITSDNLFVTRYDSENDSINAYMISRKTNEWFLLEKHICGGAIYNPYNQTLFYAKNLYGDEASARKIAICAKDLVTGIAADLYIDDAGESYGALFSLVDEGVRCGLYYSYEEHEAIVITNQLKVERIIPAWKAAPGTIIEKYSDHLVSKRTEGGGRCIYVINGSKESPLSDSYINCCHIFNDHLYYIVDGGYNESTGTYIHHLYRIRLDGSDKKLLRKSTHLTDFFSANGKLFGFATYELNEAEREASEYWAEIFLHELDTEGKPLSSVAVDKIYSESWGHYAYPVGDVIIIGQLGWESTSLYYRGFYDTRTNKFYPSEN